MTAPRFDLPVFARPADFVVVEAGVQVGAHPALPELIEPTDQPLAEITVDEPLVPLQDRNIRTLSNYWHAGWDSARPATWCRQGVAERLAQVASSLPPRFGLAVFDAWRPLKLQAELYEVAYADPELPAGFVSEPIEDPTMPPPHLTGGTVDLTLTIDGIPLALGGGFDDFTDAAHTASLENQPGPTRDLRRMLYWSMRSVGFIVLDCEWWHFEFGTRRWAAITGGPVRYGAATTTG